MRNLVKWFYLDLDLKIQAAHRQLLTLAAAAADLLCLALEAMEGRAVQIL